MYKQIKIIILSIFILLSPYFSEAQTVYSDTTKVDSITFIQTRAEINKLSNDRFEKYVFTKKSKSLPYRLLLPKNYNKSKKYPIIINFHNSSRIGNDNNKQLEHLSKIWLREDIYTNYHAFVIVPQFNERSSTYSKNKDGDLVSSAYNDISLVFDLLDDFQKKYTTDPSRIYLVGYSMGASTAQNILSITPNKFAAIVSIAAVPDFSNLQGLKNKNIFLIHGEKDLNNPYSESKKLFDKLKNNKNLIFKTFTELNHDNITIPLLFSTEIPNWLFKQKNRDYK